MPHPVLIGLAVAGGWYAWKAVKREMARIDREVEAVRTPPSDRLERDPDTGRYRPKPAGEASGADAGREG